MTAALEGGEWSAARPGRILPPGKTWYLFYRADLDGWKISFTPGFDPGSSSPLSVAIPTELPGPQILKYFLHEIHVLKGDSLFVL